MKTIIKTLTIELVYEDDPVDGQRGYGLEYRVQTLPPSERKEERGWVRIFNDSRRCLDNDVQAKATLKHIYDSISRLSFGQPVKKWSWKDE
jgi:hypothetical protein